MKYLEIAQNLEKNGIIVTPFFLSPETLQVVRDDLRSLQQSGKFVAAGIGKGNANQVKDSVRQNELCWIDLLDPTATQTKLWEELALLQQAFNRTLFLGINHFEGHYTAYGPGGFYQRHLDSFASDHSRVVSFILYLNENWQPSDGGELRVYEDHHSTKIKQDVAPMGGTLVCFLSRELEHEVLPNHAERLSFTGWFSAKR